MSKLALLIFSSFLFISPVIASEAVDSWGEASRPANSGAPISVTYGNGTFVAGGLQGTILTSSNGVDWTKQNSGISTDITRVKVVNGRFFAFSSKTLTSLDGITWDVIPNLPDGFIIDIAYGNGSYVGVRQYGIGPPTPIRRPLLTSTNLIDWAAVTDTGYFRMDDIAYANGLFVGRANRVNYENPGLEISHDGISWTLVNGALDPIGFPRGSDAEITYQNGTFFTFLLGGVFIGGSPAPDFPAVKLAYSLNGTNWDSAFNGINFYSGITQTAVPLKLATGGPYYVIPGPAVIYYSTNLASAGALPTTNWTQITLPVATPETGYADAVFGNEMFVAVIFGKIFKSNPVSGVAPLRIIQQPTSISVNVGGTVGFSVLAQGSDPITYQWRKNGTNISDATNHNLTLTNIAMADAGKYDVVITNPGGPVTSDEAVLNVNFADLNFYAGVTLRGNIGDKFLIEYQDHLDPSGPWHNAANVTLITSQSIWFDPGSAGQTNRFYRATFQGQ
jgi:hypothetical protein